MVVRFVAGNYSITNGNMFGTLSQVTGSKRTLDAVKQSAAENARLNGLKSYVLIVGNGAAQEVEVR
jgi:hypothetical protein